MAVIAQPIVMKIKDNRELRLVGRCTILGVSFRVISSTYTFEL